MSTSRKGIAVIEQVLAMKKQNLGPRAIARCLKISRNTVRKILKGYEESELGPVVVKEPLGPVEPIMHLDWTRVHQEYSNGVSLKTLHNELAPAGVTYNQFWYDYRKLHPRTPAITMRLTHKPGERTFFDFGGGINLVDARSGAITTTEFLCGVLPFSSYTYGEFVLNQKQTTLMAAMERAWQFFGGVTPYVTVDNLKAGVTKAHIYDPVVNPGFVDFANHCGFAVLPARPFRPRDKASNESGIGVIQRSFFQEVRNRTFYSLPELNQCFREFLDRFNRQHMKDHDSNRLARFENERSMLKPLPTHHYQISEWKTAKVHADCHIQVDHRFYSVPFPYVGRIVQVRLSEAMIEVFDEERSSIATHARLVGKEKVSTQDSHYPEAKIGVTRFEVKHAKHQADQIGPQTRTLVDALLDQEYPLRYLRRVQGILRLSQSGLVSSAALEYACKQALLFKKTHYEYVKSTANFYQIHGNRPVNTAPRRAAAEVHLHQTLQPQQET
jgi:hypothetical protein